MNSGELLSSNNFAGEIIISPAAAAAAAGESENVLDIDRPIDLSGAYGQTPCEPLNLTKFHDMTTPPDTPTQPGTTTRGFKKNILKRYGKQ